MKKHFLPFKKWRESINRGNLLHLACNIMAILISLPFMAALLSTGSMAKNNDLVFYLFINLLIVIIVFLTLILKIITANTYKLNKNQDFKDIVEFLYDYKKDIVLNNIKSMIDCIPQKYKNKLNKNHKFKRWMENREHLEETPLICKSILINQIIKYWWLYIVFIFLSATAWIMESINFSGILVIIGVTFILITIGKDLFKSSF